jgi:hypothetical protein
LYGFSLRWHPGYGYGKYALGVGADGGYPFYGGPGYPHPWPKLRRFGPATPFAYYGGPDYPRDPLCNYYAGIGGLAIEKPVVTIGEPGDLGHVNAAGDVPYDRGFGPFTGAIPYPETTFAPYTSAAATSGSSGAETRGAPTAAPANPAPDGMAPPAASLSPAPGGMTAFRGIGEVLGIDEEPVTDSQSIRGMQVTTVYAGSPADRAGLRSGDVIHSANGYLTIDRGNLAWVLGVATPNDALTLKVRSVVDGKVHTLQVNLGPQPLSVDRPSYLPPVGNGPPPASR